jgi:hypothetical protein
MSETRSSGSPRSPDLRRRLRARERRVKILRRRVGAVTLTLFALSWAAVYEGGAFGRSTVLSSGKVALVAATKSTTTTASHHTVSSDSTSSSAKSTGGAASTSSGQAATQSTATAVTTRQS